MNLFVTYLASIFIVLGCMLAGMGGFAMAKGGKTSGLTGLRNAGLGMTGIGGVVLLIKYLAW